MHVQYPLTHIRRNAKTTCTSSILPPLLSSVKMPPLQAPLSSISRNRSHGCELHPYSCGKIVGKASEGANPYKIAKDLDLMCSTIQYILRQDKFRTNGESLPQKPQGKSYTDAEKRLTVQHVRLNPKDTYQQVIDSCSLSYGCSCYAQVGNRTCRNLGQKDHINSRQAITLSHALI